MSTRPGLILSTAAVGLAALALVAGGEEGKPKVGYQDTPLLPGGKWHVHDGDRPQPPIVTPGTSSTQAEPGRPPSDAIVLFDGNDLDQWQVDGKPPGWKIEDGAMVIPPKGTPGGGSIATRREFADCQLHLEFATPVPPVGSDQGRGNSGVMFFGRYEVQVLDSFDNITYPDGQAGAIYGQTPPLVNASRPPGHWQTYEIVFRAPRFTPEGKVEEPAYVTLFHNGVLVQDHTPLLGAVVFRALASYSPHGPRGPLVLQDHNNPVRFRNIWVRDLAPGYER